MMSEQSIGDYRVIQDLGGGGMARVFLAEHKNVTSLRVVLKILRDPRLVDRFSQEANKLALLERDRHVCQLKHFFQHNNDTVIAMEYIEGPTLEDRVQESGRLSVEESVQIIKITLDVLAKAHARNIWHRDIKPSNIMLEHGLAQAVKVIDFGIAKAESDPALTAAGSCCGTPLYMAPEQFVPTEDTNYSLVDVYAVGVTLYNLLTGELPHTGENEFAIRDAKLNEDPVPPRQYNPSIPVEVEAVILKAIARDPKERYQSATQMKQALLTAAGDVDVSDTIESNRVSTPTPTPPPRDDAGWWKRQSSRNKALVIGAPLIVLALVAYLMVSGGETPPQPPSAPLVVSPADGAEIADVSQAGFVWSAVEGHDMTYLLQYDDNPEFLSPEGVPNLSDTTYPLDSSIPAGANYWRVRAISRGLVGPYSSTASFVVSGSDQTAAAMGQLVVEVNMASGISLNNELVRSNATSLDTSLSPGEYRVEARNNSSAERRRRNTVTITEGTTERLRFSFTKKVDSTTLRLTSDVPFADVYIDGEWLETVQTPAQLQLPLGSYRVRVVKEGAFVEREVNLRSPATYKFFIEGDSVVRTE